MTMTENAEMPNETEDRQRILLADDEASIRRILETRLKMAGYDVYTAQDGEEAVNAFNKYNPDLVVLDVMMPKMDGYGVTREIRRTSDFPIIILTALGDVSEIITGLELGADDYVTKPFSNRELVARVKANLRRQSAVAAKSSAEDDKNSEITVGDLTIHPEAYTVSKNGQRIELTHREFELLHYLAQHLGQVMTREHLLQTVWGYDYFGDVRTVDVTVRRLREKIEDNPSRPTWLVTRRGVGYYLRNPEVE